MPDCDHCGEGDLARLRLEGECTAGEEQAGRSLDGIASGAVEVEAAGITLAFTDWPTLRTTDDGLLQNVPGPSAAIKRWSVREIQVVKPQPGLCVSRGREPASEG